MKWGFLSVISAGTLVGLAAAGPIGAAVGAGAAAMLTYAFDRKRHGFANAVAHEALGSVGSPVDSLAVTSLVRIPPENRPNWCALAVQGWIRQAANTLHVPMPIPGSPGALATAEQFKNADPAIALWIPAERFVRGDVKLAVGMIPVWRRDPPAGQVWSGEGHIGVAVKIVDKNHFQSVEGNNGPTIATHLHDIREQHFLGMGAFR